MKIVLLLIFLATHGIAQQATENLPLNHYQWIMSHNSYRVGPLPKFAKKMEKFPYKKLEQWDYYHPSLKAQLDSFQLKGLEIDIYHDPKGNRYSKRKTNFLFGGKKRSNVQELNEPGLKVFHIPGVDDQTHHYTFKSVLQEILTFSTENEDHFPLFIMVELKEKSIGNIFPFSLFGHKRALSFNQEALLGVDEEIKEVFKNKEKHLFIPDSLREGNHTLSQTIKQHGWPLLETLRGKIVFVCHASEKAKNTYLELNTTKNLQNRMMFLYLSPYHPEATFIKMDDPSDEATIKEIVGDGFIVRTRSDVPVKQAKTNDYTRFIKAKQSGAQMISTDFYKPDNRAITSEKWSDYCVIFDGDTTVRLNPLFHD